MDWKLCIKIEIGNWDWGLDGGFGARLMIGIRDRGFGSGIGDWDWGYGIRIGDLGLGSGIGIGDLYWGFGMKIAI